MRRALGPTKWRLDLRQETRGGDATNKRQRGGRAPADAKEPECKQQ